MAVRNCIVNLLHIARARGHNFARPSAIVMAETSILAEAELEVDEWVRHHFHLFDFRNDLAGLGCDEVLHEIRRFYGHAHASYAVDLDDVIAGFIPELVQALQCRIGVNVLQHLLACFSEGSYALHKKLASEELHQIGIFFESVA